jgi:uncharacterized membrane protein YqjE
MATDNDRSIAAVIKDIVGNLQQIVRAEIRLAKAELRDEAAKAKRGVTMLAAGALLATLALGALLLAAIYGLSTTMPPWAAALVVGLATAILGCLFASAGAKQLKQVTLPPPKTAATIQENVQWAKTQAK